MADPPTWGTPSCPKSYPNILLSINICTSIHRYEIFAPPILNTLYFSFKYWLERWSANNLSSKRNQKLTLHPQQSSTISLSTWDKTIISEPPVHNYINKVLVRIKQVIFMKIIEQLIRTNFLYIYYWNKIEYFAPKYSFFKYFGPKNHTLNINYNFLGWKS
jgi:hypothetical protein